MSGAKQAAMHHPETMEKVRKRGATITMGRWTKPEKQQSNKLTIGVEKMQKLFEKECLTTFLKSTKDTPDDQNSVPMGTKREKTINL